MGILVLFSIPPSWTSRMRISRLMFWPVSGTLPPSPKIGYPTVASVPHSIINGMKNCMALAAVTDITFKEAETMKAFLADPTAFAVAAPVAVEAVKEDTPEAKEDSPDEDSMDGGMFDMFG